MLYNKVLLDIINALNKIKNKKQIPTGKSSKKCTSFITVSNDNYHIPESAGDSI